MKNIQNYVRIVRKINRIIGSPCEVLKDNLFEEDAQLPEQFNEKNSVSTELMMEVYAAHILAEYDDLKKQFTQ